MPGVRWLIALMVVAGCSMAAAGPTLAPSELNDGASVDAEPVGARTPVVLVHGFGGSAEGWDRFLRAYAQNPAWRSVFKPYSFRYGSSTAEVLADPSAPRTLTGLGAALRDAMQAFYDKPESAPDFGFGNRQVIVLAHSMGGIVARSMMQEHVFRDGERGGQKVLHLITLATPHHGTPLADAGLTLGIQTASELSDTYLGFLVDLTWTNFDGLDASSGRCNPWLAQLNQYAPAAGAAHGRCGFVAGNALPGFYERIIAYGTAGVQERDLDYGQLGVIRPGSATSLLFPYSYLRSGLSRSYANDGVVPLVSAQFDGKSIWRRGEAFHCDHRYIRRGYPEFVRTAQATYTDWAFCAATANPDSYASGSPEGYAVSGSIFGAPGAIMDTLQAAADAQRVFKWAEAAHAGLLPSPGTSTGFAGAFYFRYYVNSNAYLGIQGGRAYYLGPASGGRLVDVGAVSDMLGAARSAGF